MVISIRNVPPASCWLFAGIVPGASKMLAAR
jgi:hypothetical protein